PFGCFSRFLRRARVKTAQLDEKEIDSPTTSETTKAQAALYVKTSPPATPLVSRSPKTSPTSAIGQQQTIPSMVQSNSLQPPTTPNMTAQESERTARIPCSP
ncbi:MAG: hypothetical protein V4490_00290, partial [Pseudomonadota bacterium]